MTHLPVSPRVTWRVCRQLFWPLLVTVALVCMVEVMDYRHWREVQSLKQHEQLEHNFNDIIDTFNTLQSDLDFLSLTLVQGRRGAVMPVRYQLFTESATNLLRSRTRYDQIRFLDSDGLERVRINVTQGDIITVAEAQRPSQRHHDDFQAAIVKGCGEVYHSRMTLNVEQGAIEQPLKPVLRLAKVICDGAGKKQGVLVLNYLAAELLTHLRAAGEGDDGPIPMLLNGEGYWLLAPDRERAWGFMLPHGEAFFGRYPQPWRAIKEGSAEGEFDSDEGMFSYRRLSLFEEQMGGKGVFWYIISHTPHSAMVAQMQWRWWQGLLLLAGILVMVIPTTIALRSARQRQRQIETVLAMERNADQIRRQGMADLGELVAGFTHDLNTPIGVARGAVTTIDESLQAIQGMLSNEEVSEEALRTELARMGEAGLLAEKNLRRATGMIGSFKRTAIDQSSEMERRFDLCQTLQDTIDSLFHPFKRCAITITLHCQPGITLLGIPGHFSQILTNLLLNSHKHGFNEGSEAGQITVHTYTEDRQVVIDYRDNGRGVATDIQGRIFDRYFTTARESGGSGLGLYICHSLVVERMLGTIRCESEPGQGVRFLITIPLPADG